MERIEVLKILSVLRGAYPQFYRGLTRQEADATVALWEDMFRDDGYPLVAAAVKAIIATDDKGYPPSIGGVKAKMRQLLAPEQDTEEEAWGKVLKAISRGGIYNAKKEFEAFPPVIQRIIGSPNRLREWALMDTDTVNSVVASNFQRSYRAKMKQKAEFDALPADVKRLIGSLSGKLEAGTAKQLEGKTDGH